MREEKVGLPVPVKQLSGCLAVRVFLSCIAVRESCYGPEETMVGHCIVRVPGLICPESSASPRRELERRAFGGSGPPLLARVVSCPC